MALAESIMEMTIVNNFVLAMIEYSKEPVAGKRSFDNNCSDFRNYHYTVAV